MWDQTLNQIDYQNTPKKLAAHWGAKNGTLQLIGKGINIVYRFENISGFNYLRITHEKLRNKEAVSAAIDFQKHLFAKGAPICEPVQSLNNRYVEIFAQDENIFLAHVSREVPGVMINFEDEDLVMYEKWGKALAQLHLAAQTYNPVKHKFITWHNLHDELRNYVNCESIAIRKEFSAISDWLKTLGEDADNFGLTHGDHRSGNVLHDGNTVYIIDFDEPVYHWFAADIARPFLNSCIEKTSNWREKYLAYLSGYQSYKSIDNKQKEMIPWLIRMKILDMYLWTKNNWQNEIAPGGGSTQKWLVLLQGAIESHSVQEQFIK